MKNPLDTFEREVLGAIQFGLPMSLTPYQDVAESLGVPVEQLLKTLENWKATGKVRRLGAIVNHFQMGHGAGAMVVWRVPEDRIDQVGTLFASLPHVSHAYRRPCREQWPYNLYTMVHAGQDTELENLVVQMSLSSGIQDYRQLNTVRELKKVPPTYILKH